MTSSVNYMDVQTITMALLEKKLVRNFILTAVGKAKATSQRVSSTLKHLNTYFVILVTDLRTSQAITLLSMYYGLCFDRYKLIKQGGRKTVRDVTGKIHSDATIRRFPVSIAKMGMKIRRLILAKPYGPGVMPSF